jgi:hypothetical protein
MAYTDVRADMARMEHAGDKRLAGILCARGPGESRAGPDVAAFGAGRR